MEDISQDLKDMAHIIDMAQGRAEVIMTSGSMLEEAHQEIERLRADRDKWKLTAERLAGQISGQGWPDDWTVIEQAQWGIQP